MYCPRIRGSGRKAVTLSFRSWLCLKSMHKYGLNILNNRGTKPYESLFLTRPTHYLCSCTDIFLLLFTSNIFIKECICAVFSNSEVPYRSISLYICSNLLLMSIYFVPFRIHHKYEYIERDDTYPTASRDLYFISKDIAADLGK